MKHNRDAYDHYRATFPSDAFLGTYFGANCLVPGNLNRGKEISWLYAELRYLFDGVLRCGPGHQLSALAPDFAPVYVFRDGVVAPWVELAIKGESLCLAISPDSWLELCQTFISHCVADAFHEREWWQWQVEGDSVWIEVIQEALVDGRPRHRALEELFVDAAPSHKA